jgi:hypothetical protein
MSGRFFEGQQTAGQSSQAFSRRLIPNGRDVHPMPIFTQIHGPFSHSDRAESRGVSKNYKENGFLFAPVLPGNVQRCSAVLQFLFKWLTGYHPMVPFSRREPRSNDSKSVGASYLEFLLFGQKSIRLPWLLCESPK